MVLEYSKSAPVLTCLRYTSNHGLFYWVIIHSAVCLFGTGKHYTFPEQITQCEFSMNLHNSQRKVDYFNWHNTKYASSSFIELQNFLITHSACWDSFVTWLHQTLFLFQKVYQDFFFSSFKKKLSWCYLIPSYQFLSSN